METDGSVGVKGGGVNVEMQRRGAGKWARVSFRGGEGSAKALLTSTERAPC